MNHHERNRYDAFVRIDIFGAENAADFPAGSKGKALFAGMKAIVERLNESGTEQSSAISDARQNYAGKSTARENVRQMLGEIADTAKGVAYDVPNLDEKFRVPVNRNDQQLIAVARSFATDAEPHKAAFVEYGLEEDFLEDLEAAVEAFETALDATGAARGEQVGSTAEIGETAREGMIVRRQLDVVVRNCYKNDAGKLAAWESASHIAHPKVKKNSPKPPQT